MATNPFSNPTKKIPMSDAQVSRVDFSKSDLGARKSHISGVAPKNGNTIKHVGGK